MYVTTGSGCSRRRTASAPSPRSSRFARSKRSRASSSVRRPPAFALSMTSRTGVVVSMWFAPTLASRARGVQKAQGARMALEQQEPGSLRRTEIVGNALLQVEQALAEREVHPPVLALRDLLQALPSLAGGAAKPLLEGLIGPSQGPEREYERKPREVSPRGPQVQRVDAPVAKR